jgi:hypothetical protein
MTSSHPYRFPGSEPVPAILGTGSLGTPFRGFREPVKPPSEPADARESVDKIIKEVA